MATISKNADIYEDSSKIAIVLILLFMAIGCGFVVVAFELGKVINSVQTYERQTIRP